MRHSITILLLLTALVSVKAQTTLSLQECIDIAHDKSLVVRNSKLGIERAKDMQKTAFTLEPTEITLTQDLTTGSSADNSIGVGQQFELPWVYSARRKSLKSQTMVETRRHDVTLSELDREIMSAYYNIMYVREKYRILMQLDSAYSKSHVVAAAREKAGETGRLGHINADKLIDESRVVLQNTKRELLQAQYKLAVLMNCDTIVEPREKELTLFETAKTTDTMDNTYLRLSEAEITAAEHALTETRREALPTVSLEAKYYTLINGLNPYHIDRSPFEGGNGFIFVGVGVNVPLSFGAHSAKVRAAKRDVEMQHNNRLMQQQELQAMLMEQRLECEKALQTISYFREKGLKQADDLIRIAQVSYEQGEIDYIEMMDNYRSASDMRLQYIEAVNQYNQAVIKVKGLKG